MKIYAKRLVMAAGILTIGAMVPLEVTSGHNGAEGVGLGFSDAWCTELASCYCHKGASCHISGDPVEQNRCDSTDGQCIQTCDF
jgi:hypothetical protein